MHGTCSVEHPFKPGLQSPHIILDIVLNPYLGVGVCVLTCQIIQDQAHTRPSKNFVLFVHSIHMRNATVSGLVCMPFIHPPLPFHLWV